MNMVVRTNDAPISLQIDDIGDVIETSMAAFEPLPEIMNCTKKELIDGIYKLETCSMICLNVERLTRLN